MKKLSTEENKVRALLIRVASGKSATYPTRRVSYKALWEHIRPQKTWGRGCTRTVVLWIWEVSAFELKNDRPLLNEIVTPKSKLVPTQDWRKIKAAFKRETGVLVEYKNHEEAQEACWRYWTDHAERRGSKATEISITEEEAEEGFVGDKKVAFTKRNQSLINQAKKRDDFQCQACGFYLIVSNVAVIDCHHKVPFRGTKVGRVTKLSDLVCLCPTCHRIAHTKSYPLSTAEIRSLRSL